MPATPAPPLILRFSLPVLQRIDMLPRLLHISVRISFYRVKIHIITAPVYTRLLISIL